jgi:hypothetical protein
MKAVVFRRKSLPRGNPDIGSILRKMTECPCAAGQIIAPFHGKLKFHFFPHSLSLISLRSSQNTLWQSEREEKGMNWGEFFGSKDSLPANKKFLLKIIFLAMLNIV